MQTIKFIYDLKQEVQIKGLDTKGIVVGYYCGETGAQYQVAYFLNGDRTIIYLYPEEICKLSGKESSGFLK